MLRHNFLLIFRNFRRFKSTFFINLIGLSSGLACALMIYLWVHDELSTDKFHENNSRLYQVFKNNPQADGTLVTMPHTPAMMARLLAPGKALSRVQHIKQFGADVSLQTSQLRCP